MSFHNTNDIRPHIFRNFLTARKAYVTITRINALCWIQIGSLWDLERKCGWKYELYCIYLPHTFKNKNIRPCIQSDERLISKHKINRKLNIVWQTLKNVEILISQTFRIWFESLLQHQLEKLCTIFMLLSFIVLYYFLLYLSVIVHCTIHQRYY